MSFVRFFITSNKLIFNADAFPSLLMFIFKVIIILLLFGRLALENKTWVYIHIKDWNILCIYYSTLKLKQSWNYSWKSHSHHLHNSHCTPWFEFKFCITIGFDFSWVLQPPQEILKTMLGASKVYLKFASSECNKFWVWQNEQLIWY